MMDLIKKLPSHAVRAGGAAQLGAEQGAAEGEQEESEEAKTEKLKKLEELEKAIEKEKKKYEKQAQNSIQGKKTN